MSRWQNARWDLYAPLYDVLERPTMGARRRSFALLDLQPGERVLVLGCGTGLDFRLIPPGVSAEAIDVSQAMVERACRRARHLPEPPCVRLMDAQHLRYGDATFDAAVMHLVLAVLPDPGAGLEEVARVLRPGGRASVFDKFVPGDLPPSLTRRVLDVPARLFATSITERLSELVAAVPLDLEHDEPMLGGQFRLALMRRSRG